MAAFFVSFLLLLPSQTFLLLLLFIFENSREKKIFPHLFSLFVCRLELLLQPKEREGMVMRTPLKEIFSCISDSTSLWEMKCGILSSFSNYSTVGWNAAV